MTRTLSLVTALMLFACEGPAGVDGLPGADGQDGANGQDGADGSNGTNGSDGEDGEDGEDGQDGQDLVGEPEALSLVITDVEASANPVVSFTLTDQDGAGFDGLTQDHVDGRSMRWSIARLEVGEDGDPDTWQSYINDEEDTSTSTAGPDGVPVLTSAIQATYETAGTLTGLGDGLYTYTYGVDITGVTDPVVVTYDADLLHRVATQLSFSTDDGNIVLNATYDFVPGGGDAPATRAIVATDSCNECHGDLTVHGSRYEMDYCVVCHNPGSTDANSGNTVDFPVMVHKIHMGAELTEVQNGGMYTIWGHNDGEHDYSHVGYPQDQNNCLKCHDPDDTATPDAGNYLAVPTIDACGSCHDDVDFATGDNHAAGAMANNASCAYCHTSDGIEEAHVTANATPNNPDLPDGQREIEYELLSATVGSDNALTVEFQITADGTALDISALPDDLATPGRFPGLLLAWASPTESNPMPADWNNLGNDSAQPTSISLGNLIDDEEYTYSYAGGTMTAVIPDAFPTDAAMRTVGIQGYFQQYVDDDTTHSLHTISRYLTVTGDDARRVVASNEGCASCHEWFEGHGGNRVYETQVCAMCHNPNLSSSGRELDIDHPEASNNLKDLVHGIHGASVRDYPLDFVRNRSGGTRYTFLGSESQLEEYPDGHLVTYPNDPADCTTCHVSESYLPEEMVADLANSTHVMGPDETDIEIYAALRETVPNEDDLIVSPTTAACNSCHNSDLASAHMEQNGGAVLWYRWEFWDEEPYETCALCHGEGAVAPVSESHGL